ncbi:MAG: tyrosine-type recombinase/integrase [PVC group bacterium]|nr:tyrosine-type recombinase/integrase [PVC group bacterium]
MGKLRDQMIMEMELRNHSPKTIKAYIRHVKNFTRLFNKSPAEMGTDEIRKYLHHLKKEKKVSWSNINIAYCGLKFFYTKVLHRRWDVEHIPRPRGEKRLPNILAQSELQRIFDATTNLKNCAMLMVTYSGGLRVSETSHLKITDIDSQRMLIRIAGAKGNKDRYTLLSKVALNKLRHYYKIYRPTDWLFEGKNKNNPISDGTIQKVFRKAKKKAGIKKPATVHTLRHSFATHLMEAGVDIFTIQRLLGHAYLKTTSTYIHVERKRLQDIINPLDRMMEDKI